MARFDYDVVIIGLGFGGSVAALRTRLCVGALEGVYTARYAWARDEPGFHLAGVPVQPAQYRHIEGTWNGRRELQQRSGVGRHV